MLSWIALPWKAGALIACAIGIAAACARLLDTDQAEPSVRWERELRLLADRIAAYGHGVRRRYPTGDVVVRERELAVRFRKAQRLSLRH